MLRSSIIKFPEYMVISVFILLVIFSTSVVFIPYIEFHDFQRICQILLLGLVLLDVIFTKSSQTGRFLLPRLIRYSLFALLGLVILSTAHSVEPRFATIEVSIFVALCYLALFVARFSLEIKQKAIQLLTYTLIASIVLYMLSFYTGYLTAMLVGKPLVWPQPFFGFSNIRLFQQYQLWTLGLIYIPLLTLDLSKKIRSWLYITLIAWWVLLFYAASRGAILSWIIAMLITGIIYRKQAWAVLRTQLITAATGLTSYLILFKAIPTWIASHSANMSSSSVIATATVFRDTVSDRIDLWEAASVMIKNFPILGVGPMHFYFYNPFGTHPHNSLLQIAAEWGLPATMIILGITLYAAKCWFNQFGPTGIQNKDSGNQQIAIILFFTMVMNGTYSMVDGVIVMPISQVLMFTMIGLMIGQYVSGDWYTAKTEPTKRFHFRPVLAGVTLVLLVWSVMPELVRGLTSYDRHLQPGERAFSMAPNTINPRIWMQQRRPEHTSSNGSN